MKALIAILIVLFATAATAQPLVLSQMPADGVYVLTVQNGKATLQKASVLDVGPPTPVDPVDPVDPDLGQTATKAIAAIPSYADRETHIRQLAFSLNMLTGSIANSPKPTTEGIALVKSLFTSILKDDAGKWAGFWPAVDRHLAACANNSQLAAAFGTIQQALADATPVSSTEEETFGVFPTYGLQADGADGKWLKFLMEILPVIMEIIKLLAVL